LTWHVNMKAMALDPKDRDILFDLRTKRQDVAAGWWFKVEARDAAAAPGGLRYSLTLHDPNGLRVLGYDNDHGHHHCHPPGRVEERLPYDFTACADLVAAFFTDLDRYLSRIGVLP